MKIKHGTTRAYQYHKCRCVPCKKAMSRYMKDWRSRKDNGRRNIEYHQARRRAVNNLIQAHPEEFQTYLHKELSDIKPERNEVIIRGAR